MLSCKPFATNSLKWTILFCWTFVKYWWDVHRKVGSSRPVYYSIVWVLLIKTSRDVLLLLFRAANQIMSEEKVVQSFGFSIHHFWRLWINNLEEQSNKRSSKIISHAGLDDLKTGLLKSPQFSFQFFVSKKFRKWFYFFTCILLDFVVHEITKKNWPNCHFENRTADFLLRWQNSLR